MLQQEEARRVRVEVSSSREVELVVGVEELVRLQPSACRIS